MLRCVYRCLIAVLLPGFLAAAAAQAEGYKTLEKAVLRDRLQQFAIGNSIRGSILKRLFKEAGCGEERLVEQRVRDSENPNLICTLPGTGKEIIIVGAHFDKVRTGDGVIDNWSGASLLPSLFQSLNSEPRRHTFVFVGFTDEEKGHVGSGFYAKSLTAEEVGRVRAMINLDTLGLGPTKVWASNSDPGLVRKLFDAAADMKLPVGVMNVEEYGDSDGKPFRRRNIPILTLHSVTRETLGILHTSKDNSAAVKFDDYYDSYRLIAGFLASLDLVPGAAP